MSKWSTTKTAPVDTTIETLSKLTKVVESTGVKNMTFSVPLDIHTEFKLLCTRQNRSMSEVLNDFIVHYVDNHKQ